MHVSNALHTAGSARSSFSGASWSQVSGRRAMALAVWLASSLAGYAAEAAPLDLYENRGRAPAPARETDFARLVDEAADLIRDQLATTPSCQAYFAGLGVDLEAWLAPEAPPFVVARPFTTLPWRGSSPICGGAQARPPFELLFVDPRCFRGRDVCDLASLLLHEIGHLARRDTRDNEPPGFFAACRLSFCVNPARYH